MISIILFILSLARFYDSQSTIFIYIRVQDIIYFAEIYNFVKNFLKLSLWKPYLLFIYFTQLWPKLND